MGTPAEIGPWATAWQQHLTALAAGQPAVLAVLELHAPADTYEVHSNPPLRAPRTYVECDGCEGDGYEREPPEWPCRTITAIAAAFGERMHRPCPQHPNPSNPQRVWPDGTHDVHIDYSLQPPGPCPVGRPAAAT